MYIYLFLYISHELPMSLRVGTLHTVDSSDGSES
jgi:hypothetical protein